MSKDEHSGLMDLVSAIAVHGPDGTSATSAKRPGIGDKECLHRRLGTFHRACCNDPFGIAGDWHVVWLLVRAPHRALRCIGNDFCCGEGIRG